MATDKDGNQAIDKDGNQVTQPPLSSLWSELSEHLIASFWEVDREGKRVDENVTVKAPILDGGSLDITLNWQSPFESAGIESMATGLFAMLQSGAFQPFIDAVKNEKGKLANYVDRAKLESASQSASNGLKQFEGRTGITKLNSTQIFSGMPPVKFQITILFRAWRDPVKEVEEPFNQLMKWALPKKLAVNGTLGSAFINYVNSDVSLVDALLPSVSPVMLAIKYKGRIMQPMVIESIGMPITSPIDKNGKFVELAIPLSMATLTAIDRDDWVNYSKPQQSK